MWHREINGMKAMILAAGEGTRLRPLTLALPKPMVPLAHVPLLVRTIRLLDSQGITEIAVNLYHKPDTIRAALGDGTSLGVRLHYSDEPTLMGTAGGVKRMQSFLDEPFLVLYGDNLYQADFAPLTEAHRAHVPQGALVTLATFTTPNPPACGLVVTDADGRVTRFQEKPPASEVFTDQANAGVYVLQPEVLDFIPEGIPYDFGKDVFPALLAARPGAIYAQPLDGYLQDTGTVANYRQANWDLIEGRVANLPREPAIAPTAVIEEGAMLEGRNILGAGVRIERGARVRESILWENVRVEAGAVLDGAILGRNVRVGAGVVIEAGAVLGDGEWVRVGM